MLKNKLPWLKTVYNYTKGDQSLIVLSLLDHNPDGAFFYNI